MEQTVFFPQALDHVGGEEVQVFFCVLTLFIYYLLDINTSSSSLLES